MQRKKELNLGYYEAINQMQAEFHASMARHKLLIGGYGAGKTYPAIHEVIFHCMENPRHNFYIFRNTWPSVEEHVEADFARILGDAGLIKFHDKKRHNIVLINDCTLMFRPLTLGKDKLKGVHMCGFLVDDPNIRLYHSLISMLFSRLRNPPNVTATRFISIITANLEGRDWLWSTFIKDREPGGDDEYAYWICPTTANPTLPENYVSDMERIHSKEWVDRYIHCKMDSFIGLIYPQFNRQTHLMQIQDMVKKKMIMNIMAVDVGYGHASVILNLLTDGKAIYVANEWYAKGLVSSGLARLIIQAREWSKETFKVPVHRMIIDPASSKTEQTSGSSVREDLRRDFGLRFDSANNAILYGITAVQDLILSASGNIRLFYNVPDCYNLSAETEIYRWKEPRDLDTDHMEYKNEPVDRRDDCVDALRYGVCFLKRYLEVTEEDIQKKLGEMQDKHWEQRFTKLKIYQETPALMGMHLQNEDKQELTRLYRQFGFNKKKIKCLINGLN